jgi:predicted ATPase
MALAWAAGLASYERNPAEADRLASDLIELSTRRNFVHWLAIGAIYRGWARSVSGDCADGIPWIERGIRDYRATGAVLDLPCFLGLKAVALHLANRTSEALEAIDQAEASAQRKATQNTASKKRMRQEDVNSDCHFGNFLQFLAFVRRPAGEILRRFPPNLSAGTMRARSWRDCQFAQYLA